MGALLDALHASVGGRNLSEDEAAAALEEILAGECDPAAIGALLASLRIRGETADELVGFARVMRAHAAPVVSKSVNPADMVDTCGTGGDGASTFNISTVAAFVVAGAGVPVAKHGNRSISSLSGSADVLEAAGANVQLTPDQARAAIDETGVGFLFAPLIHPAMKHVQPVRKALKMRTVFNLLGPLTNPAGAGAQVIGVYADDRVRLVADALNRLGVRRAFVVHGSDGLDEITLTGPTRVAEVRSGQVRVYELTPGNLGLKTCEPGDLAGGTPQENAELMRRVLGGEEGPLLDVTAANAGAALVAGGLVMDLAEAVDAAREVIRSGRAATKLDELASWAPTT